MMTSARRIRAILALLLLASASTARADDWPQWRGPARNGISAEKALPWSTTAWTAEVGTGFSSMAVAKGRVVTIGNADDTDTVYCLDAEKGNVLWKHSYPSKLDDNLFEGGPTSTPAVDGDRVYTLSRWGDAFCFDLATGKVLWSAQLHKDAGFPIPTWGFGGSPVVHGTLLLLNVGDAGVALETGSGKVVWKSAAKESAYSTPHLIGQGEDALTILGSAKSYVAVNAKTGAEVWRVKWVVSYGVNAADPIVDGDRMFLSSGYSKGGALFKIGKGEPEVLWQNRILATQQTPAVLIGGHLYGFDGDADKKNFLKCVDFATGAEKWSQPITRLGTVIAAGNDLILLSGTGELMIAPASPEGFKPTHRTKVGDGKWWTVPVVANGRLYCRNADGQIVCLVAKR